MALHAWRPMVLTSHRMVGSIDGRRRATVAAAMARDSQVGRAITNSRANSSPRLATSRASRIANPFYNDTSIFCASLFHSVQTGDSIVDELAREGGALWPIDLTDESAGSGRPATGDEAIDGHVVCPGGAGRTLSGHATAFREAVPENRRDQLPEDFDAWSSDARAESSKITSTTRSNDCKRRRSSGEPTSGTRSLMRPKSNHRRD